jgi:hypothetical protein
MPGEIMLADSGVLIQGGDLGCDSNASVTGTLTVGILHANKGLNVGGDLVCDSNARVTGTLAVGTLQANSLNVGRDPQRPAVAAFSATPAGDVTAIGKLMVKSLFVEGTVRATDVQVGPVGVDPNHPPPPQFGVEELGAQVHILQDAIQRIVQALQNAGIKIPPGTGSGGNWGG